MHHLPVCNITEKKTILTVFSMFYLQKERVQLFSWQYQLVKMNIQSVFNYALYLEAQGILV